MGYLRFQEPCLLSHVLIYNKSVLEWEIAVGLRYKLMGVSVTGLEPESQPVVNHLLPQITSHKQDAHDMHLQLLQDITNRLLVFLPQLESDVSSFSDSANKSLRFLAMLVGPFYPILHIVNERSRSTTPFASSASSCVICRPDPIFLLLRKAYKESDLGTVCRGASRILHKLLEPAVQHSSTTGNETTSDIQEALKSEALIPVPLIDYSSLFGEEFHIPDDQWDASILNVLDIGAVEEGILHVLYACASQVNCSIRHIRHSISLMLSLLLCSSVVVSFGGEFTFRPLCPFSLHFVINWLKAVQHCGLLYLLSKHCCQVRPG